MGGEVGVAVASRGVGVGGKGVSVGIGVSVGVGVGAGVADFTLNSDTTAYIAGMGTLLSAGDDITIAADGDVVMDLLTFAGSGGIVGLNASYANADSDNDVSAYISNGAVIANADDVFLTAHSASDVEAESIGASGGIVAIGASIADATETGSTLAYVGDNLLLGRSADPAYVVNSLTIDAAADIDLRAKTLAAAGGIVAGSGSVATASAQPTVKAYIGSNVDIAVTDLTINATVTPKTQAEALGINAGIAAVGASIATAENIVNVQTYIGPNGTITATNIAMNAVQNLPGSGRSAQADATGAVGGLIGANATIADTSSSGSVTSYVGTETVIISTGNVSIRADANSSQKADADSYAVGLVALGANLASSESSINSSAYLGEGVHVGAGDAIGGLVDGETYFVVLDKTRAFDPVTAISANQINLGPNHGLRTGDTITYQRGDAANEKQAE